MLLSVRRCSICAKLLKTFTAGDSRQSIDRSGTARNTLTITPNATSTTLTVQLTEANNANSIRVETAANGSMTNGSGGTIEFTVTSNELSFGNFSSLPSAKTMVIGITAEQWQQAAAGTYTGTMSFTISAE